MHRNNKGGVGKTTLAFHCVMEYAADHPDQVVIVIDVCPQANISQTLLNDADSIGHGAKKWRRLREATLPGAGTARTIAGYLNLRLVHHFIDDKVAANFLIHVKEHNKNAPNNIYLLLGDPAIEYLSSNLYTKVSCVCLNWSCGSAQLIFMCMCVLLSGQS